MSNRLLVENKKLIWACAPKDYNSSANTEKYVSLKNYDHISIIISTGAWAGGTAAVTLKQSTLIAAGDAKSLGFLYQWNDVAVSGTLVKTAVTANTFNIGTANKMWVIEVDAIELDVANNFDCLAALIASPGASADLYSVSYVLSGAAFRQATLPSPLTD